MHIICEQVIDLRAFYCFTVVARHRSFTRAAEELGMAQPNLSAAIARLEQRIGGPLFIRRRLPLDLTSLGHTLLPPAEALAREADLLDRQVDRIRREIGTGIVIGGHPAFEKIPLRQTLIDRFMREQPGCSLRIMELPAHQMENALVSGEVDFLLSLSPLTAGYHSVLLAHYPLKLVIPAELPIAQLDAVPLEALAGSTVLDWTGIEPDLHAAVFGPLLKADVVLVPTPELSVPANIHYAAQRRAIFPIFGAFEETARLPHDMVMRPVTGSGVRAELRLLAMRQPVGGAQRTLWAIAGDLAAECCHLRMAPALQRAN